MATQTIPQRRPIRITKEVPQRRHRIMTQFQEDILLHGNDPQVRALVQARNSTFRLGENVDSLTAMLKVRLLALSGTAIPAPKV